MACQDKMKITGWMERDLTGDPVDPNAIGPFWDNFTNWAETWIRGKFDGLCDSGCQTHFNITFSKDWDSLEHLRRFTVRCEFVVECIDPKPPEEDGGK